MVSQSVGLGLDVPGSAPIPPALPVSPSSLLALPLALFFLTKSILVAFQLSLVPGEPSPFNPRAQAVFHHLRIIAETPPGLCPQPTPDLLSASSGILASFNPFMAKLLTIPCHSVSTPKGSILPLAFLSLKLSAVWFSNFELCF